MPKYHLNHVYGISKILNYGLVFIIGYESDFSNKYKHIASAMFYNKSLRNYFLDLTIFNSDRKWKNKCDYYKVDDFYSSAKISKEILVKNSIINSFAPYVILTYDNKSRKEQEKIVSKEKNIQQGVGFTIRTASDSRLKKVEADILYLNSKKTKSVLLTFNIKF